jgi:hypothetical protein
MKSTFAVIVTDKNGAQVCGISEEIVRRNNGRFHITFGDYELEVLVDSIQTQSAVATDAVLPPVL